MAGSMSSTSSSSLSQPLHLKYPISSQWEFKLNTGELVKGEVYCTDPVADLVILQDSQNNDIRMISITSIKGATPDKDVAASAAVTALACDMKKIDTVHIMKVLEEREKRAIRLAQESLKHLNPKAPPKGQMAFDRLLKACNEVIWKGESIIVLDTIKVDPPYTHDDCKLLQSAGAGSGQQKQGSLDRVQKIVDSIHAGNGDGMFFV
mmetsp:Transcript_49869/g.55680  ORF Transcript_49869/g.55680 Transcript_49869/m.55680 type:complete len:207 (+) Transcript_49869:106-726(+)